MSWSHVAVFVLGFLTCLVALIVTALIAVSPWAQERLARRVAKHAIDEAAELSNATETTRFRNNVRVPGKKER